MLKRDNNPQSSGVWDGRTLTRTFGIFCFVTNLILNPRLLVGIYTLTIQFPHSFPLSNKVYAVHNNQKVKKGKIVLPSLMKSCCGFWSGPPIQRIPSFQQI